MPRFRPAALALAALVLLPVTVVLADIDLELRSGDQSKGTIDPGAEVETYRFRVPAGAKLTVKAKPGKKGPPVALSLAAPASMGSPAPLVGTGAAVVVASVAQSGEFRADVTSRDGVKTGDYSFSAKWASPRSVSRTVALGAGDTATGFSADSGARVKITAKAAKGSAAIPRVTALTGPGGAIPVSAAPIVLPSFGDYTITIANDGAAGDVALKLAFTPPKSKPRKIDVTAKKTGTAGNDGAYARVIDADGGLVSVPTGIDGLQAIEGTSVDIPAGALPVGSAILIGTSTDINLPGSSLGQIGPPVLFGPEGQKFGTTSDPQSVSVSIPLDLGAVGGDTSKVRVYTRDAKGKVSEVPAAALDFTSKPGFVTFPTPHFSSYVAAADVPPGDGRTILTYAAGLTGGNDVTFSQAGDDTDRVLFVTDDTDVLKDVAFSGTSFQFQTRTFAGGGTQTQDGTLKGDFDFPGTLTAVLSSGDIVYVGTTEYTIYRIDVSTGAVTRFLGDGVAGDFGDGGPTQSARISDCSDLMEDSNGDLWIVDAVSARIRIVDASGNINALAGTGTSGSNGDSNSIALTQLDTPRGIAERFATEDVFVAERGRIRILHRDLDTVETLAGDPAGAVGCGSGPQTGTSARFDDLAGIAFDFTGNQVFVTSDACDAIYSVNLTSKSVRVELGVPGQTGLTSDGNVGPGSRTNNPRGIFGISSVVWFSEAGTGRVRQLALPTGP